MTDALIADAWLSGLLGRPAFRLSATADPATAIAAPAFVDAKVPASDTERARALSQAGYRLIENNVRLDRPTGALDAAGVDATIRMAAPGDASGVKAVAESSFCFDRFHVDPAIPNEVANCIKASWAGNFFHGQRGERMVVAADGGSILGFLQILDRPEFSVIDLIAVAARAQGRGLASAMIAYAIGKGRTVPWRVGTQAANIPSLRLYERLGFLAAESQHVFHRHVD